MRISSGPCALFTCLVIVIVIVICAGVAGCRAPAGTSAPLAAELSGNDPDAQLEFWHALPERKVVGNDEAFHALLLFADGEDAATDYDGRVALLKGRGLLSKGFTGAAGEPVRRGTVAVALSRALAIGGGVTMRVFGVSPRYATRELQYAGLFPPSSPQQTFSGAEFLGIIGRAEDYQRVQADEAFAPAAAAAGDGTESGGGGV